MLDKIKKNEKLYEKLSIISKDLNLKIVIDEEYSHVFEGYYVIGYNSKEYLVGGDSSSALTGNLPIVISKKNHTLYELIDMNVDLKNIDIEKLLEENR